MQQTQEILCLTLFREMWRIRLIEEAIASRYSAQQMRCPVHLSIGQEGVAVGVCRSLDLLDYVISGHRAHAHYLAKGGSLERMLAELYGKSTGCTHGKGGSMHLIDLSVGMLGATPILGSSIPVGVGVGLALKMQRRENVIVVFFGDAATEEGVWAESLNFAALKRLPVVFVCENNLYSVSSPMSVRQPIARSRAGIARAHGIESAEGDGNEVDEVYTMAKIAVAHAKSGEGPFFLEFCTYRHRENCGPHVDDSFRPSEEVQYWHARCPIRLYKEKMLDTHSVSDPELLAMHEEIAQEISTAFDRVEVSPFPTYYPHSSVFGRQ